MPDPLLYEIDTRSWLRRLSDSAGTNITLAAVPDSEFARWRKLGFTHIWLMGVWTTGPCARSEALENPDLQRVYATVLPDWRPDDVLGSPYSIADYHVPTALGGDGALQQFRSRLRSSGLRLILDFVPNHLGVDHPWVRKQPDFFVQAPKSAPDTFQQATESAVRWLAHGKDPYFPGWTDTVQLDYRRADVRSAMTALLRSVAAQCDGVRCDMAMLLLNDVLAKTWEKFPATGSVASGEYWDSAISAVKSDQPDFVFLAEAYWGLEARLHELGFDYTYDKTLYDRLIAHDSAGVQTHLLGLDARAVRTGAHFLENHDEVRIASVLSPAENRAAALVILGLPGMRFLHDGELEGAVKKTPIQLGRQPAEPPQPEIERIYSSILAALPATSVGQGTARLLRPQAWPDNQSARNMVLVQWQARPPAFDLVAVNLAPQRSQCTVALQIDRLGAQDWTMKDLLGPEEYFRRGEDMVDRGLYLDLPGHGAQLFHFRPAAQKPS